MKKIFLTAIFLITPVLILNANYNVINKIQSRMKKIKIIKINKIQKKIIKKFKTTIISKGSIKLVKPGKIILNYHTPIRINISVNKDSVSIYNVKTKNKKNINLNSMPSLKSLFYNMFFWFSDKKPQIKKDFIYKIQNLSSEYKFTLYPKKLQIREILKKITINFSKHSLLIKKIKLWENKSNDTTEIIFYKIKTKNG